MDRFRDQHGFTLVEALVAVFVGVIALLGLYALVDASNKLTKQQTEVADVQQSARIGVSELSRIIRQSRIGGLYFGNAVLPVANNGALLANADLVGYGGLSMTDYKTGVAHSIRQGTDVIEVRGVLLGDRYILDESDVVCTTPGPCPPNQTCAPCTRFAVTIPWRTALGFQNFPLGGTPSLSAKTRPFYFVVVNGENQQVITGTSTYLVPVYVAGLVDPASYTPTASTFAFTMDPSDPGARKLNATTALPPSSFSKSIAGGPIDVVRFFVDDLGDTHPSLAEAAWDPHSGEWDIQTLIEEVEDFQIAYGVDGIDGSPHDGGASPVTVDVSGVNRDEWVGNVATEVETRLPILAPSDDCHGRGVNAFIDLSITPLQPPGNTCPPPPSICVPPETCRAVPALHSVWISLVVKSADPDFVYDGPGARGIKTLDSTAASFSAATGRPYRRRPLSLAVSLRNNGLYDRPPTPTPTPGP